MATPTPRDLFGSRGRPARTSKGMLGHYGFVGTPNPDVGPPSEPPARLNGEGVFQPESGRPLLHRRRPANGYGGEGQALLTGMAWSTTDRDDLLGFLDAVPPRAARRTLPEPEPRLVVPQDPRRPGSGSEAPSCASVDPDVFFPPNNQTGNWFQGRRRWALERLCRSCPVQPKCREWAIQNKETGWWGGTSDVDRAKIRQDRATERRARIVRALEAAGDDPSLFDT